MPYPFANELTKQNMVVELLRYSIIHNLKHIPSALSQLNYLYELFSCDVIKPYEWNFVIGKPFGSQAYYLIWNWFYNIPKHGLSYGVKTKEIDFVDYSEETLGNALGVASGIAYNGKRTWCNISDAALQMGPTLEAIQFIGFHKQDIVLTVDYNNHQLTGSMSSVLGISIQTMFDYFSNSGWLVYIIDSDEFDGGIVKKIITQKDGPIVFLIKTKKGDGVLEMEQDPVGWHYKELVSIGELTIKDR